MEDKLFNSSRKEKKQYNLLILLLAKWDKNYDLMMMMMNSISSLTDLSQDTRSTSFGVSVGAP
jgi:hypothetical protein